MSESEESAEQPPDETEDRTQLLAQIAAHDEELAETVGGQLEELSTLEDEVASLETELEDVEERLEHTRADYKNYKERAKRRQEEIRERATEDLIERLLEVRDNLGRALQDESGNTNSLREGVELTRKQFDRVLKEENVERIEPQSGAEVDPNRHEVMMRVESDQPADTIESVYRPGYEMAGKILRPAQVTVSEGSKKDEATEAADGEPVTADDDKPGATPGDGESHSGSETEPDGKTDSDENPE